ncbi:IS701 family transposase [Methylobacterium sp. SyP6R]|uniref:IS701 family transposase n=1 Tax=Methylobacterium sp. SyP6R TaxID=2718876 RepID=UPI001F2E0E3C|nr:transposase [Methylobacterium sp. SyP6R]MCF4124564.1 transposase [Methylobacterium sp. SyP6R]
MPDLPARFAGIILAFAPLFVHRSWCHARILLLGAILAPGRRTVASLLRIMGRAHERRFVNFHRVLNRAAWSPHAGARILLGHLITAFAPRGPVVLGLDDTIERRWGKRIRARGIYRDPVRSSGSHFVKTSGLRWLGLMLLAPIPFAQRVWALPFLTALVPSERACREQGHRHKPLLAVGRQLVLQARRWLPGRDLVLVADSSFAALAFLAALSHRGVTVITRLRLDAALYDPAPPRRPGTVGRPRIKGARRPSLAQVLTAEETRWHRLTVAGWYGTGERTIEVASDTAVWWHTGLPAVPVHWVLIRDPEERFSPQALLCTDLARDPEQILTWFVRRWSVEVTFQETRAHLGVETQRQWSDKAITRTTPCLLALFSIVTLLAARLRARERKAAQAAWYPKARPTFSDALASVRRALWREQALATSRRRRDTTKPRFALPPPWTYALCNAA